MAMHNKLKFVFFPKCNFPQLYIFPFETRKPVCSREKLLSWVSRGPVSGLILDLQMVKPRQQQFCLVKMWEQGRSRKRVLLR
jgi:hypothetical protein